MKNTKFTFPDGTVIHALNHYAAFCEYNNQRAANGYGLAGIQTPCYFLNDDGKKFNVQLVSHTF